MCKDRTDVKENLVHLFTLLYFFLSFVFVKGPNNNLQQQNIYTNKRFSFCRQNHSLTFTYGKHNLTPEFKPRVEEKASSQSNKKGTIMVVLPGVKVRLNTPQKGM